jgi:hypothetical protein
MSEAPFSRTAVLGRQGLIDSGLAVLTAVMLLGCRASPAAVPVVGAAAVIKDRP